MHEAQKYKMSLEPSSFSAAAITGSKGSLQQTRNETSSRSHKTRNSVARVSKNRSKVSNDIRKQESLKSDKSASTRHTSTVHNMSSSEKRHELASVKRRHEELERQYQVSVRLKEQDNRLKFERSLLELEQFAESH